jgi:hypothetical protein
VLLLHGLLLLQLRPDGTVHAAGGTSYTTSTAIANPLPYWLTLGAYNNRPAAESTAYTQIPLLLRELRHLVWQGFGAISLETTQWLQSLQRWCFFCTEVLCVHTDAALLLELPGSVACLGLQPVE